MSNFRIKKEKKKKNNNSDIKGSSTLDKKHKQYLNSINKKKISVPKLKRNLEEKN